MTRPILGGFVTCRPRPVELGYGKEFGLTLMSDLHIGAPNVNYKLIKEELRDAEKRGDRILINGDVFDAIISPDVKRFTGDCLHPRLQGRRDIFNSAIEWAVDLLLPFADGIDLVGIGNHETAVEKHHALDPVRILVHELQRKVKKTQHVIHYGGYMGYVDYMIGRQEWKLWYYHGRGGASASSMGLPDFRRKNSFVIADAIWMGHRHNRCNAHVRVMDCPLHGQGPLIKDVRYISTGAYMHTYTGQSQASLKKHGRRTNYAADGGCELQGQGGARVKFRKTRSGLKVKVEQ